MIRARRIWIVLAAAAISGEDPIATGIQGSIYALRTVILPFIWIFNPQLLLIDVDNVWELLSVVLASTVAMCAFAAITMGWFRVKLRWWELVLMTLAVIILFRPDLLMDRFVPEYRDAPASQVFDVVAKAPANDRLVLITKGTTIEGDEVQKTVAVNLGLAQSDARKRLSDAGLQLTPLGDAVQIASVRFGSRAKKAGVDQGFDILAVKVRTDRPTPHWFYVLGYLLIALVWWVQGRRMRASPSGDAVKARARA